MKRQDERKRFLSGKWWKVNRKRYFNPVFLQGAGLPRRMPGGEVMDAYIETHTIRREYLFAVT
jgi:hypothetical protein